MLDEVLATCESTRVADEVALALVPCNSTQDEVLSRFTAGGGSLGVISLAVLVSDFTACFLVGLIVGEEDLEDIVAGPFAERNLSISGDAWTLLLVADSVSPSLSLSTEDREGRPDADFEERSKLLCLCLCFPFPLGVTSTSE